MHNEPMLPLVDIRANGVCMAWPWLTWGAVKIHTEKQKQECLFALRSGIVQDAKWNIEFSIPETDMALQAEQLMPLTHPISSIRTRTLQKFRAHLLLHGEVMASNVHFRCKILTFSNAHSQCDGFFPCSARGCNSSVLGGVAHVWEPTGSFLLISTALFSFWHLLYGFLYVSCLWCSNKRHKQNARGWMKTNENGTIMPNKRSIKVNKDNNRSRGCKSRKSKWWAS